MTNAEKKWPFNKRVGAMVYRRHLLVEIHPYVPSRFVLQLGFSQGVVGAPTSMVKRYGDCLDRKNEGAFYSAEDTNTMIYYPKLPTSRTVGFTEWFVERFSEYRGLFKKDLNVKKSSRKAPGRSNGVLGRGNPSLPFQRRTQDMLSQRVVYH